MSAVSSVSSLVLDLPPSCIEFSPANREYFVVGTYDFEKLHSGSSQQSRSGSLVLFRLGCDRVSHKQTVKTDSAVLDIHFHLHKTLRNILGVATSTGSIVLYRLLNDMYNQPRLEHYRTLNLFDPSVLVLSLVWCTRLPYQLGVSLSNGEVYLIEDEWLANAGTDETSSRKSLMMKHDLEAWNLAFTPSGQASFSGGDDTALRYCSTKPGAHTPSLLPDSSYALPARTWSEGKLHKAGVTAILPLSDQTIVTGSYDDHIRVVSVPNNGRRAVLKELNLGGGVWRLKLMAQQPDSWLEEDKCSANFTILASCMHAGTRVVRLCCSEDGEWSITVLARFEEHKSMNYGSDFQPVTNGTPRTIVSTSFYDKLLYFIKLHLPHSTNIGTSEFIQDYHFRQVFLKINSQYKDNQSEILTAMHVLALTAIATLGLSLVQAAYIPQILHSHTLPHKRFMPLEVVSPRGSPKSAGSSSSGASCPATFQVSPDDDQGSCGLDLTAAQAKALAAGGSPSSSNGGAGSGKAGESGS